MTIRAQLRKHERIIERNRFAWQVVATALMEIRDLRLYRAEGFSDFGRDCRERLHLGRSTVNRQITIGEVYKALASTGAKVLPTSERQMRPVLPLRQPNQAPEVWGKKVVEVWAKAVSDSEITKKPLTQRSVARALQELGHDPNPKEAESRFDLQKYWTHLEDLLCHERELWPVEYRHELVVRIVGLVSGWEAGKGQQAGHSAAPAIVADAEIVDVPVMDSSDAEPEPQKPDGSHGRFKMWQHVNWRLKNRHLAAIWNLKPLTVRQMRLRKKCGRAYNGDPEVYKQEVEQEKDKAKAFSASLPVNQGESSE